MSNDDLRSPHLRVEGMNAIADDMGPGGICGDCGHFAERHSRLECLYPRPADNPCNCQGMLWGETRYVMDPSYGPLRPA